MRPQLPRKRVSGLLFAVASFLVLTTMTYGQDPATENKTTDDSKNTITGQVVTREGEPVATAYVSISRIGANSSNSIRVDGSGAFKSEPLAAGLYRAFAYAPGYTYDPQPVNNSGYYHPGDSITITMTRGGVITGKVTNSDNAPVIATSVRAFRVRDQNGKPMRFQAPTRERLTDDRGVYRLYGLLPGAYVVSAGGPPRFSGGMPPTAYEIDAPTYAPSSTRDTALEITVNSGDEITLDIQYRGEPGHSVSGTIAGASAPGDGAISYGTSISLLDLRSRATIMNTNANPINNFAFALYGVPDGEYELYAMQGSPNRDNLASPPKRIVVQGADVTGINLTLVPLASIDGRVVLETDPKAPCGKRRAAAFQETVVLARRYQSESNTRKAAEPKATPADVPASFENLVGESAVEPKGNFNFKNLQGGNYRIDPREPASGWYVRSIAIEPAAKAANLARDGVAVRPGERVSGLTVTIREGAARLQGRISPGEGQLLPAALRVYLVPAEHESTENVLRFYEVRPESNGSFIVDNLAPGKYWIVARPMEETESGTIRSIRQDSAFRSRVLGEAEALKKELAFKPCEQAADFDLPYAIPTTPRQ